MHMCVGGTHKTYIPATVNVRILCGLIIIERARQNPTRAPPNTMTALRLT